MKAFLSLATTVAAVSLATSSHGASFNCHAPRTAAERTICVHPSLNALDRRLTYWYGRARLRARTFDQTDGWLVSRQRAWVGERDACGPRVFCLREKYLSRIRRLQDYAEHV